MFRTLLICLMLTCTLSTAIAQAQPRTKAPSKTESQTAEALLLATELRARTQRVARLYLELGAKTRIEKTGYALSREFSAVEKLVGQILASRAAQDERSTARIAERWREMREPILAPYSRANGELVYALSEELFNHSQKLAQSLESQIQSEHALAVDVATRVMAQTERISKALIQSALTNNRSSVSDLESWRKEQTTGLAQLAALSINDDYSRGSLALGTTLTKVYGDYVAAALKSLKPEAVSDVAKASDGLWDILASTRDRYEITFRSSHGLPVLARG